jgi:hypothetical protein
MTGTAALFVAHIICTTLGFGGLIAANVGLALAARGTVQVQRVREAVTAIRIFGPLLGIGVLLGFGMQTTLHVPANAPWLLATYAAIVIGLALQAYGSVRYMRASADPAGVAHLGATPATLAAGLTLLFIALVTLMVGRPGGA